MSDVVPCVDVETGYSHRIAGHISIMCNFGSVTVCHAELTSSSVHTLKVVTRLVTISCPVVLTMGLLMV